MKDEQLDDLKQFITRTITQSQVEQFDDIKQFVDSRILRSQAEQLEDVKQFVDSRISQSEGRLTEKIEVIDAKVDGLRQEMLHGFAGVGDAIEEIHDRLDKRNQQINHRFVKIEKRIALKR